MTAKITLAGAKGGRPISAHRRRFAAIVFAPAIMFFPHCALADEGGVSFWLPGLYGSLAAVPVAAPGWSLLTFSYYTKVSAGADVAIAREVIAGIRPIVQGIQITMPAGALESAIDVLEAVEA